MTQRIILVYNTSSYLYRLRADLIDDLQKNGFEVYAAIPFDHHVLELEGMGVKLIEWPILAGNKNPLFEVLAWLRIYKILGELKPDIVFNFTIKPVIYSSIAAKLSGCASVFSMIPGRGDLFKSGSVTMGLLRVLLMPLYKMALRANKCVFFQNKEDRAYFVDYGYVSASQTKLINGSGVNTSVYTPNLNIMNIKEDHEIQFLMVARMLKDKGVEDYFTAASLLAERYHNVHWNLVGGFTQGSNAVNKSAVNTWQEKDYFTYHGELNDVKPILTMCSVFVLPSYYNEGLPRSILEAMSCGLAVITTDWPGCRETVIEGKNGYLVPIKSPKLLAAAMEKLLLKPTLLPLFSIASRDMAKKKFDTSIVNAEIISTICAKR